MQKQLHESTLTFSRTAENTLSIKLAGAWSIHNGPPSSADIVRQIETEGGITRVNFDMQNLTSWDSGVITFLLKVFDACSRKKIDVDRSGLPEGVQRLIVLATAVPEQQGTRKTNSGEPFLVRVGERAVALGSSSLEMLEFIGAAVLASIRFFSGKARFRRSEFISILQACGAEALPIVCLISLLVGLILAFVGAVQLKMFGAQIYVASLVGIGMLRVMGAIMTGIIMAGRTGAAFAAELGTMQVNEEIDALQTMGISPMEFLVLPRMLALTIMMPLLCVYADLMGILGGLIVGVTMLDLNFMEYYNQTWTTVSLTHFWIGLFHGTVFGVLIALSGCLRGMQCGRSASAVGNATTSAVVTAIVSIIVATAVITVVCNILKI